ASRSPRASTRAPRAPATTAARLKSAAMRSLTDASFRRVARIQLARLSSRGTTTWEVMDGRLVPDVSRRLDRGDRRLNNLGNPKMAVFFASVLPQFTAPGEGMASTLTFAWLAAYAIAISTAGRLLRAPRAQRAIEAVSGTVLIGLGAKIAADARELLFGLSAARRFSSSGGTSSLWVPICQ